jgi:YfiH family protein
MTSNSAHPFFLVPAWPAPKSIQALVTLRKSPPNIGRSSGAFAAEDGSAGLNLGLNAGEDPEVVKGNRQRLSAQLGVEFNWLTQVHGCRVARIGTGGVSSDLPPADASWTDVPGAGLAVLIADCLPVLFCDREGTVAAAAHAGWRGLAAGVLEETVESLPVNADRLLAYLGPSIGRSDFEVGRDVFDAFTARDPAAAAGFKPGRAGKWYGDLQWLARRRLEALGVTVFAEEASTYAEPQRFYSFRRTPVTGRMAALIWIKT